MTKHTQPAWQEYLYACAVLFAVLTLFIVAHGWPEPLYQLVSNKILGIPSTISDEPLPFVIQLGRYLLYCIAYTIIVLIFFGDPGSSAKATGAWNLLRGSFESLVTLGIAAIAGLPILVLFDGLLQIVFAILSIWIPFFDTLLWPDTVSVFWLTAYIEILIFAAYVGITAMRHAPGNKMHPL